MSDLFRSYHPYSGLVGTEHTVLVTEWASDNKHLVGHNKSYTQVRFGLIGLFRGFLTSFLFFVWNTRV